MSAFQRGDVVQLKSGGERMTVATFVPGQDGEVVICQWFEKKSLKSGQFHADMLEKATKPGLGAMAARRP